MPGSVVVPSPWKQKTSYQAERSLAYDNHHGRDVIVVASAVSLTVPDVAASSLFFTGALGFREELVLQGFVQLRRDDAAVDVELCAGAGSATNTIVCFTVADLPAEYERLRLAAPELDPVLRHEPWGERSVWLTDPNGIAVRLVEWAPPAGHTASCGATSRSCGTTSELEKCQREPE
jgi:catechol 2,3-dioxygenase-like lactoylglutathione lyase family enzyme